MSAEGGEPDWLSDDEQEHWRAYIVGSQLLQSALDRDLRAQHGISFAEYEVLVRLTEAHEQCLRMAALAESLHHSRSRVTHTVARMEKAGLVRREGVTEDGRGVMATLTDTGAEMTRTAAHTHVRGVRRYLVDVAEDGELQTLGGLFLRVWHRLPEEPLARSIAGP